MARPHASEIDLDDRGGWRLCTLPGRVELVRDDGVGYQPAALGDRWRHESRQSGGHVSVSEERVVAAGSVGALWVARVRSGPPDAVNERDLVIGPEGVLPDIGEMTTAVGVMRTVGARGVFLPHALAPGLRWTYSQSLVGPRLTIEVEASAEVLAEVDVEVPAGRFTAMLVRSEICSRVVMDEGAGGQVIEQRQSDESHHARGVGLVRHSTVAASGHRIERVLLEYRVGGP